MTDNVTIRIVRSFDEIAPATWARLTGASKAGTTKTGATYHPFLSHAYLAALERSGSAVRATGWLGNHLLMENGAGEILGAIVCYQKTHSRGEYVFDQGWADAFERAGGRYYPKLQCSVPFTPATGQRLLVAEGQDPETIRALLAGGLQQVAGELGVSSAHLTFLPQQELPALESAGYLHRTDQQFHFLNPGYRDHADFLDTLASRKRKALKKERRAALENGIEIDWLTGKDLTEEIWDQFFAFYMDTGSRKWGKPYLTRDFYSLIGERMADDILLVMARRQGRYVAGAINFIGTEALYGRHWGCIEDHPYLHFEVCYHQAIDFALSRGLARVEAGAQGEHKLARGYVPVTTHSAHFIAHSGLRRAVADYLEHERREVEQIGDYLAEHAPFRKGERQQVESDE